MKRLRRTPKAFGVAKLRSTVKAIVVFVALICSGCVSSVYKPDYLMRVLMRRDANSNDYLWKQSIDIPVAATHSPWQVALDPSRISKAFSVPGAHTTLDDYLVHHDTYAFVVLHGGRVLHESYYGETQQGDFHATFSVSKSILSLLVGQALDRGDMESIDAPVTQYLPELLHRDERFAGIRLSDLLDMRSGLAYDSDVSFPFVTSDPPLIYYATDLEQTVLKVTQIERDPGTFLYNDYNPNLLAVALMRALGENPVDRIGPDLFEPIGAEYPASWSVDKRGFGYWESGFNATARDLARIGQFMLDGPNEIISAQWRERSFEYEPTGTYETYDGGQWAYRNGWWRVLRPGGEHDIAAIGRFGQFLYLSPKNDVIFVRLGGDQNPPGDYTLARLFYAAADRLGSEM